MKKNGRRLICLCGMAACLSAGCGVEGSLAAGSGEGRLTAEILETQSETALNSRGSAEGSEETERWSEGQDVSGESLEALKGLLGMKDEETAELFGGGEENWTEDRSFYIGRIYQADLYGTGYPVYTSCGQDKTVESVSIWLVNGERDVTDEETELWVERLSGVMGKEPAYDGTVSEGGSVKWRWEAEGTLASLYRMKDQLSIYFQAAVGELR